LDASGMDAIVGTALDMKNASNVETAELDWSFK
jgi:hypothetical protein